jgi:hypothetical protein
MTVKPVESEHNKYLVNLLFIVALIAPFFFIARISTVSNSYRLEIVAVLWSYVQWANQGGTGSGFLFFDTLGGPLAFLLSGFRFVFIIAIRKHQKGLVSKRIVWVSALLSQIPMTAFLFTPYFMNGLGGPIPILLIIGLIIDREIGIEPPITPWRNESPETKNE